MLIGGLCALGHAQNARYDGIVWSRNGFPSPAASVSVCNQPASITSTPPYCSNLAALCSSASDVTCASANPVTADSMGNFHFYVAPGVYTVQSYNSGLTPFVQSDQILACPPGISCTLGAGTFSSLTSATANPALSGTIRLAKSDCSKFRNNANNADISGVCLNGSDQITIGSGPFIIPAVSDTAVGKNTTDTLASKTVSAGTFTGTQSGGTWTGGTYNGNNVNNSVTLLNTQAPIAPITGTAADVTMFTYSMPANAWGSNKCITVDVGWTHSTGTAAATYRLKFGGTTISSIGAVADTSAGSIAAYKICNIAQNSQYYELLVQLGAATNTITPQFGTSAIDFSQAQTVSFTMSVANTDQVTPKFWKVSLDQ